MQGIQDIVKTVMSDSVLPMNHLTPQNGMGKKGADLNNFGNHALIVYCKTMITHKNCILVGQFA